MNKEETKKAIQVMQDFIDGKEIEILINEYQYNDEGDEIEFTTWVSDNDPDWNWVDQSYRTKPEPKYKPYEFTLENLKHLLGNVIKSKNKDDDWPYLINSINISDTVTPIKIVYKNGKVVNISLQTLFEEFTWEDGSPCGEIIEKE